MTNRVVDRRETVRRIRQLLAEAKPERGGEAANDDDALRRFDTALAGIRDDPSNQVFQFRRRQLVGAITANLLDVPIDKLEALNLVVLLWANECGDAACRRMSG